MKNKLFQEALSQVKPETTEKIQKYTDMIDDVYDRIRKRIKPETREKVRNHMIDLTVEKIIDEAYRLYMPQVRSEITDLSKFLLEHFKYPPENILEIGTKYGGTFYIWNSLWPETVLENGVVSKKPTCISIDFSDGGIHGGISEEEMDKRDLWFLERFANCHFIRGDSHSWSTFNEITKRLNPKDVFDRTQIFNQIDFLFIDGDHSYEGVKKDFKMYHKLVKKEGLICFHDIIDSQRHRDRNVYVAKFWRELTEIRHSENPDICLIDGFWYEVKEFIGSEDQDWAGLGLLKKL